jgi:hypothetical protein
MQSRPLLKLELLLVPLVVVVVGREGIPTGAAAAVVVEQLFPWSQIATGRPSQIPENDHIRRTMEMRV